MHAVAVGADRLYFTVGHYLISDENSACWIPIRRNTLSDGDAKACLCTTVIESGSEPSDCCSLQFVRFENYSLLSRAVREP